MNGTIPRTSDWRGKSSRFRAKSSEDTDPLLGLINLFDASMVLVVAMLLSLIAKGNVADMAARLSQQDVTIVTNPGKPDVEMVIKRGNKIEKLKATGEASPSAAKTAKSSTSPKQNQNNENHPHPHPHRHGQPASSLALD